MAGGGQQADDTLHTNAIGWAILLVVLAVLVWLFWHYFHVEVRNVVRWIRYGEMALLSPFIDNDHTIMFRDQPVNWEQGFHDAPRFAADQLTRQHLSYFGALAMQPLRIPFILFLAAGGVWAMFRGPNTQYRVKLGLEGLIKRQAENFPIIAPFADFNPAMQPPRPPGAPVPAELPLFAEALGPEEWLAYYTIPNIDGKLDEEAAGKAFRKQLGGRWKGVVALAPYKQILLAAFCLKAARKRRDADEMLGRLALCWESKKGLQLSRDRKLLGEARKILRNKDMAAKTLAKCNQHAFETTALLRGLATAREEGGVLSPSQFLWLRAHDRTLWYPLNNLGRQSFHPEALGAMAHFKAERMTQRPIPVPKMEGAVETIVDYMKSNRARPIPPLDYSQSKTKRAIKKPGKNIKAPKK